MKPARSHDFISVDPLTQKLALELERFARTSFAVLLYGETGAGKEVAARAVHQWSTRKDKAFVALNCAALPESLVESELFGHEKGAFTGAVQPRLGAFELADGGTLFLDELGELSLSAQAKLLRALESKEIRRVGAEQTKSVDVRLIAATNRDLRREVLKGRFREDLYYRLAVCEVKIPALRDRLGDVAPLCAAFLARLSGEFGCKRLTAEALKKLLTYSWPGNIRELRNVLERAVAISFDTEISPADLRIEEDKVEEEASPVRRSLRKMTKDVFLAELERNGWNRRETARVLGIARSTVKEKIKRYGLQPPAEAK